MLGRCFRIVSAFGPLAKNSRVLVKPPSFYEKYPRIPQPARGHAPTATTVFDNGTEVILKYFKIQRKLLKTKKWEIKNKKAYMAMINEINKAKKTIWVEMYIIEPDFIGSKVLKALSAAAKRGCE